MQLTISFDTRDDFINQVVDLFLLASEDRQADLNVMLAERFQGAVAPIGKVNGVPAPEIGALEAPAPPAQVLDAPSEAQTPPVHMPVHANPTPQPVSVVPLAAAPQYTQEQLGVAGVQVMDAGREQELLALLARFGVQAVMQLTPEQYGPFAAELRALGATI